MTDDEQPLQAVETIGSARGLQVSIVDIGATIQSITLPTPRGRVDAVLSYARRDDYREDPYFLGSTVGPVPNRIRDAKFALDRVLYHLEANDADRGNCLHGGTQGVHRQRFLLERDKSRPFVSCKTELPHGLGGFPGNRSLSVVYAVIDDWSLAVDFTATSDRDTVMNLANHAYFNLGGPIDNHRVRIFSDAFTPVDESKIPTGEMRNVGGTEFDLREMQPLGDRVFDHNFVLAGLENEPQLAAQLESPATGLQLTVLTTQPAIQVYTGDYLSEPFHPRQGICLEAQGFPDAPNQPLFPSIRLGAGNTYRQRTIYRFTIADAGD